MVELRFYCKLTTQTAGTYAVNIHDKQNRMQHIYAKNCVKVPLICISLINATHN